MSLSTPELSKKTSSELLKTTSSEEGKPQGNFRKLLEVSAIDENPHRCLFSLIEEDEEEEESAEKELLCEPKIPPPIPLEALYTASPVLGVRAVTETASNMAPSFSSGLSDHIEALFEKMASQMIVMDLASETQTSFSLDNPQFSSSSFFGTTIIIKEFATAPKAFNIEIISNPLAIGTIQRNQQQLLSLFAQGNFHFTVHRLETQIEQDSNRPLLHRHEEEDQGQKEQHKDQNS